MTHESMKTKKSKRGGARPGAGRPPLPAKQKKVAVSFRISRAALARLRAFCGHSGQSQTGALEAWIATL